MRPIHTKQNRREGLSHPLKKNVVECLTLTQTKKRKKRRRKKTKWSVVSTMMMWDEWCDPQTQEQDQDQDSDSYLNFDFFSLLSKPKDYYKILEVDYDATEDAIRSNYIRLALKWHPDKQKDQDSSTSRFQDINEAYQVLSDPVRRREYDTKGMLYVHDYNIMEYLNRYKGLILTCNGLGIQHSIW